MFANIVFSVSLFVCLLLVKLQAIPHTIHVPGVSSTAQALPVHGSWILRPQNLPLTGSLTFGNKKYPLGRLPGRVVASAKSDGDNKTELNSTAGGTSKNRSDDVKPVTTDKTSSNFKFMTSVWELNEHGIPTLSLIDDYKKLASRSCYVILQSPTIVSEEKLARLEIYYWIGSQSSDEDAATTANVAMLNRYVYNEDISMKLYREVEGQESNAFKKLFKSFKIERKSDEEASKPNDTDRGRIFMFEGKNFEDRQEKVLELNEVELPLTEVLGDERSCFVFVLEQVYISCGVNANIRYKFGAEELAKIMMNRKGLKDEEVKAYRTDILFPETKPEGKVLAQFFKKFEHLSGRIVKQRIDDTSEEFTRKELRRILCETATKLMNGKEWFSIKVTRIFENTPDGNDFAQEENILPDPFIPLLLKNHSKDCLLIDSKSNVGIFVWMGENTRTEVSAECARRAELYLRKKEYNYANRITFVHQEDLPLEVDTAQIMVEFFVASDEDSQDQSSEPSSTAEDSSQEFDDSVTDDDALLRSSTEVKEEGEDVPPQNDVSSSKKAPSSRNRKKKKMNHEDAVKRLKVLLQPARSEITNQYNLCKDGLTFDQLAELLEYSKHHSGGDELCEIMNIQPAGIEAVLTQLETLHSKVRNRDVRKRLITLSSKLKQQKSSPPSDDAQV